MLNTLFCEFVNKYSHKKLGSEKMGNPKKCKNYVLENAIGFNTHNTTVKKTLYQATLETEKATKTNPTTKAVATIPRKI